MSNLNRVRLSCCWVGVGLGCDNFLDLGGGGGGGAMGKGDCI